MKKVSSDHNMLILTVKEDDMQMQGVLSSEMAIRMGATAEEIKRLFISENVKNFGNLKHTIGNLPKNVG